MEQNSLCVCISEPEQMHSHITTTIVRGCGPFLSSNLASHIALPTPAWATTEQFSISTVPPFPERYKYNQITPVWSL
jgi:hypothetical protein